MADKLQNLPVKDGKLETFEQAFSKVKKDSEEYRTLMDAFKERLLDVKDITDEEVEDLSKMLDSVRDISSEWETVNTFFEKIRDTSKYFLYDTEKIRNLFGEIQDSASTLQTILNGKIKVVRGITDLTAKVLSIYDIQGAAEEKSLKNLERIAQKRFKDWELTAQALLGEERLRINGVLNENALKKAKEKQLEQLSEEIKKLNDLKKLREQNVGITRTQINDQEKLVKNLTMNVEFLDSITFKAGESILKDLDNRIRIAEEVSKSTTGFGAANFLGKITGNSKISEITANARQEISEGRYGLEAKKHQRDLEIEAVQEQKRSKQSAQGAIWNNLRSLEDKKSSIYANINSSQDRYGDLESQINEKIKLKADKSAQLNRITTKSTGRHFGQSRKGTDKIVELNSEIGQLSADIKKLEEQLYDPKEFYKYKDLVYQAEQLEKKLQGAADSYKNIGQEISKLDKQEAELKNKSDIKLEQERVQNKEIEIHRQALKDIAKELWSQVGAYFAAYEIARRLWKAFSDVDRAAAELKQNIGSWEISTAGANWQLASSVDWLKTATVLTKNLGINAVAIFDKEDIARGAELQTLTGATAEQAANLVTRSKLAGQNADQFRDSLTDGANAGNKLNHSVVTLKEVQDGVLNASNAITLSYGSNAKELGKAVVAAANLGMELAGVENISKQLINFESSISNEMEAQLLTGMELNLTKAREYALNNDLEGVAREIANQGITSQKFGAMNLIQQESLAKSLGLSREELAKSLILRQLNNGASAEAVARAHNMTKEQIEAMSATDRWNKSVEKLRQAFAPILNILGSILAVAARIVGFAGMLVGWCTGNALKTALTTILLTIIAINKVAVGGGLIKMFSGMKTAAASVVKDAKGFKSFGKNIAGAWKNSKAGGAGADLGNKAADSINKAADSINKAADTSNKVPKTPGKLTAFGRDLRGCIKALGTLATLKAAAIFAATIAVVGAGIAAFIALVGAGIAALGWGIKVLGNGIKNLAAGIKELQELTNVKETLSELADGFAGFGNVAIGDGAIDSVRKLSRTIKSLTSVGGKLAATASSVNILAQSISSLNTELGKVDDTNLGKLQKLSKVTFKHSGKVENKATLEETETISNIYATIQTGFNDTVHELREIKRYIKDFKPGRMTPNEVEREIALNHV